MKELLQLAVQGLMYQENLTEDDMDESYLEFTDNDVFEFYRSIAEGNSLILSYTYAGKRSPATI